MVLLLGREMQEKQQMDIEGNGDNRSTQIPEMLNTLNSDISVHKLSNLSATAGCIDRGRNRPGYNVRPGG